MSKYKLIACDMDGTLIGSDYCLSEENKEAIRELAKQGVIIVPATGRTIAEARIVFDMPEIRYFIYSNGSGIIDKVTGEKTFFGLETDRVKYVFDVLSKYDTLDYLHMGGKLVGDEVKMEEADAYHVCEDVKHLMRECGEYDSDLWKSALEKGEVELIVSFFKHRNELEACRKEMEKSEDLCALEVWAEDLEFFTKKAGKEKALAYLAEKIGIERDEIIAAGDGENDAAMLKWAGKGLAMKNAADFVKEAADGVACTNDEHIMKYLKENYF